MEIIDRLNSIEELLLTKKHLEDSSKKEQISEKHSKLKDEIKFKIERHVNDMILLLDTHATY